MIKRNNNKEILLKRNLKETFIEHEQLKKKKMTAKVEEKSNSRSNVKDYRH